MARKCEAGRSDALPATLPWPPRASRYGWCSGIRTEARTALRILLVGRAARRRLARSPGDPAQDEPVDLARLFQVREVACVRNDHHLGASGKVPLCGGDELHADAAIGAAVQVEGG